MLSIPFSVCNAEQQGQHRQLRSLLLKVCVCTYLPIFVCTHLCQQTIQLAKAALIQEVQAKTKTLNDLHTGKLQLEGSFFSELKTYTYPNLSPSSETRQQWEFARLSIRKLVSWLSMQAGFILSYSIQETLRLALALGTLAFLHRFLVMLQIPTTLGNCSDQFPDHPPPSARTCGSTSRALH